MASNFLETLPDFDDMDEVARVATSAKAKLEDRKNFLESYISDCIKAAYVCKEYWVNGKPPTASYCNSVIAVVGNTEEDKKTIQQTRDEIVEQGRIYQEAKLILDNMKDRIDVWQTHSANQRKLNS